MNWISSRGAGQLLHMLKARPCNGKASPVVDKAVSMFVKIGAPAVTPLVAALKEKRWEQRIIAIRSLGLIRDSRAVAPLRELSQEKYPFPNVKKEISQALKRIKSTESAKK